jgi:hypothetical protein
MILIIGPWEDIFYHGYEPMIDKGDKGDPNENRVKALLRPWRSESNNLLDRDLGQFFVLDLSSICIT